MSNQGMEMSSQLELEYSTRHAMLWENVEWMVYVPQLDG